MKFRPAIGRGDFDTKARKIGTWLEAGERVRVTVMFRGREVRHPEFGQRIIDRLAELFPAVHVTQPTMKGRNLTATLQPRKRPPPASVRVPVGV